MSEQKSDDSTGLMYYGARYYDTTLGRFTQADSIVPSMLDPQSWNRYAYALNNPVRYTDPSGHMASDEGGGGDGIDDNTKDEKADELAVRVADDVAVVLPVSKTEDQVSDTNCGRPCKDDTTSTPVPPEKNNPMLAVGSDGRKQWTGDIWGFGPAQHNQYWWYRDPDVWYGTGTALDVASAMVSTGAAVVEVSGGLGGVILGDGVGVLPGLAAGFALSQPIQLVSTGISVAGTGATLIGDLESTGRPGSNFYNSTINTIAGAVDPEPISGAVISWHQVVVNDYHATLPIVGQLPTSTEILNKLTEINLQ